MHPNWRASGLVEVNVKATPNEKAKAYYKNNMSDCQPVPSAG